MTARVVAFANQSGGCGKTTGCTSVANVVNDLLVAAKVPGRILVLDVDLQCDASHMLGYSDPDQFCSVCNQPFDEKDHTDLCGGKAHVALANMNDVLAGDTAIKEAILPTALERVDLVPGSKHLAAAEKNLAARTGGELRLRQALLPVLGDYRLVLVDSPASLGVLAVNIFAIADDVVAAVKPGMKEIRGLVNLEDTIDEVNRLINSMFGRHIAVTGVLIADIPSSKYSGRIYQEAVAYCRAEYGDRVLPGITRDVRVSEAYSHQKTVPAYDPTGQAAKDFTVVVQAMRDRGVLPNLGKA